MNHQQTNIDTQEIAKFERMAADWWNPAGQCKPLHDLNPIRLGFIQAQIDLSDKKVIDIGCGGGILTESMARLGAETTGIDMSTEAIKVAQAHANQASPGKITYQITTAETMAEQFPNSFDVVTCMELLEHVPDPISLIKACATLVKPNGHIFFSTINRNPKAYLFAIIGAEYLLNMLPKGTHDYAKFIQPSELASWIRKNNLTVNLLKGMNYNLITQKYSLSDDVSVNYLMHCRK